MIRRSTWMQRLAIEARASMAVLMLLMLVPVLHPVAESFALQNGSASDICSSFGAVDADLVAVADDHPDCVVCTLLSVAGEGHSTTEPIPRQIEVSAANLTLYGAVPTGLSQTRLHATGPPSLVSMNAD